MIISLSHKFIFLKVPKTASSSVEEALLHNCTSSDIITPDRHRKEGQNNIFSWGNIFGHMTPSELLKTPLLLESEFWDFKRIAVCRNPWDKIVSAFWWIKVEVQGVYTGLSKEKLREKVKEEFPPFVYGYLVDGKNGAHSESFYFSKGDQMFPNYILRFESLQSDFDLLCRKLEFKKKTLPYLKCHTRLLSSRYKDYYDEETINLVAQSFPREISTFGYSF